MAKRERRQDDETKAEKGGNERKILLQYACFGLMTDLGLWRLAKKGTESRAVFDKKAKKKGLR